jgi:hypothetical protein
VAEVGRRRELTKELLERLYWGEWLSIAEVAERVGHHSITVWHAMKRFGIPRRAPKRAPAKGGERLRQAVKDLGRGRSGVYVLRDGDGQALYVGRSRDVQERVRAHVRKPGGDEVEDFDFFPAGREVVRELERFFIRLLRPRDNRR